MSTANRTHRCDTDNPQRPCCWAARNRELAMLKAADEARMSRYGSQSCKQCGEVYSVVDGVATDHACQPMYQRGFIAQGID